MSPEFLKRAQRVQASSDPDTATAQTIQKMCELVRQASGDCLVQASAQRAVEYLRGGPAWAHLGLDPFAHPQLIGESCWWYAKHAVKFVHHSEQIWKWLGERDQLQLLISPDVLVRMRTPEGDCADFSMLIAAMLESLGQPWEFVTVKCSPRDPSLYTHVYVRIVLPNGEREALDASHGKYPGWKVPDEHTFAYQVWDSNGNAIQDQDTSFTGLHNYAAPRRPWGMWGYRGLGCGCSEIDPDTGACLDPDPCDTSLPTTTAVNPDLTTPVATCPAGYVMSNGQCVNPIIPGTAESSGTPSSSGLVIDPTTGGYVVPASNNTAALAALLGQVAKSGMTLAQLEAIPPGTVINPNGQIIRQATGYPITSTGISTTLTSIGSSPIIWLLLGGVVLVMAMGKR
jgi:hypothetical protein